MTRIGIVGLGNMGLAMAKRLKSVGFDVIGFDIADARRDAASHHGVIGASQLGAVFASAETVVSSLPTSTDVEAIIEGRDGLLQSARAGALLIDTTTSEPDVTRRLAGALRAAGHGLLDAPVSGGPGAAAAGRLTMMIGGEKQHIERAKSVLDALAARVIHVGASGAGHVVKLVNNLLCAAHLLTTSESLRIATQAGVDPHAALEAINAASGRSAVSEINYPRWILPERFDSGFAMGLMTKDVRLAAALGAQHELELPIVTAVASRWAAAQNEFAADDDFNRIVELAGTQKEAPGGRAPPERKNGTS